MCGGDEKMPKIAVVGSINVDMTVKTERIPGKGETLPGTDLQYIPGGKGANQAVAAARLGAETRMFGCVGDDDIGRSMLENLQKNGVNTESVKAVQGIPTGLAVITVGENDNTIVVVAGANACVTPEYIDGVRERLLECDIVLLQHEIPQETVEYVAELCREHGIRTVLNPAPARAVSAEMIEHVTYLTPNEHEAAIIFPGMTVEEILRKYPEKVLVTQGEKGVSMCLEDGRILNVPARRSKVVDTTGAGDTLNGAFTVQIAEGKGIAEAVAFANTAAGLSTEQFGAQGGMPTREEVEKQ